MTAQDINTEEFASRGNMTGADLVTGSVFNSLVSLSLVLRGIVDWFGRWASLLFVPLVIVTVYDVCLRKT